jgi:diacylglycerol O-acyltransferase
VSKRENISAVDTAWLRMDRPANLMMICGVLTFERRLSLERLRAVIAERFLVFRRFRQVAQQTATGAQWRDDSAFNIATHVIAATLPSPGGDAELQHLVSTLMATPLPRERPMWQFQLVDHHHGGSALIARIHHCYADGIALVRVMLSMTDAGADGPPALPFDATQRSKLGDDDPLTELLGPLTGVVKSARKIGRMLLDKGAGVLADPAQAVALATQGSALTGEIAKLATMQEDSPTRFKGRLGIEKRVAWASPLPLDEVKTVGRALGASINDFLI